MDEPIKLLFVCSGNQCRSPFAEGYVNLHADAQCLGAESAGTLNLPPTPAPPETQRVASDYGIDLSKHRSRFVGAVPLEEFDLIICFEFKHIAELIVGEGADADKVFLLGEMPSPLPEDAASPREMIALARSARKPLAWKPGLDVADPIGRSTKVHAKVARTIAERLDDLLERLGARTDPP